MFLEASTRDAFARSKVLRDLEKSDAVLHVHARSKCKSCYRYLISSFRGIKVRCRSWKYIQFLDDKSTKSSTKQPVLNMLTVVRRQACDEISHRVGSQNQLSLKV
ncbi:hypothetical protein AVEN_256034-1 [Araneus ventricosus]|uniref:Uncharacterized protein n=1 Tax=Araneus ventricosus TaxID=182803 RepID=A0A4Y2JHP7_ARAVE|nr:hypothetical protein AVEN_256034-1 [Araneus ventricosus]